MNSLYPHATSSTPRPASRSALMPEHARELILADGLATDIGRLLEGAQAPVLRVGEVADPVRAISLALAGESVDVLHIVAHGRREGFRLGGHWVDAAALRAQAHLVAGWNVRRIALWSCSVGQGSALVRTLARLTGAQVFASDRPLGRVGEERLWRLDGEGEGAPQVPFAAPVLAAWDHQLASFTFSQVWQVTNTADKESNNHTFNYATPLFSAADGTIVDGTTSRTFTGNDVSATLTIPGLAQPVYGWISRPIKVGGQVVGFYMWTDSDFTSLALAQADGNADADGNTAQNTGYILAVPGKESAFSSGSIGSSSDRVDTALNSLIPVNSGPVAKNDTATLNEDAVNATGSVLTNDTDANGDTLVVTGFTYTVNGTTNSVTVTTSTAGSASISGVGSFTLASNGTWTFTPEANYTGPVPVFTYTVADPWGLTSSATLSLSITPVNDAPTVTAAAGAPAGSADLVTTPEDTPIVLALSDFGTFADVDGDALVKLQITGLPTDGRLQYDSGSGFTNVSATGLEVTAANITAGKLRFVPDANENGSPYATFTFKVSDGTTYSASSYTVTVNVTPVNDAPVANNDNTISGGTYAAFAVESGCHVTGTDQSGATLTNAGSNQSGNVRTNDTDVDTGTTLTVTAAASIAANDSKAVTAGSTSVSNYATVTGLYGSLRIGADGSYIYLPANTNTTVQKLRAGDLLTETFSYTVSDGSSTATATLTAVIKGSNDAPDAVDDVDSLQERALSGGNYGMATGNVITNDTDPDTSPTLTVVSSTAAATGSSQGNASYQVAASSSVSVGDYVFWDADNSATTRTLGTDAVLLTVSGQPVTVSAKDANGYVTLNYPNALASNDQGKVFATTGASRYIGFSANSDASGNYKTTAYAGTVSPSSTTVNVSSITGAISAGMSVSDGTTTRQVTAITTDGSGQVTAVTLDQAVSWSGASLSFTATAGTTLTGKYGTLTFAANGGYTYTLTSNALTDNQSYVEAFAYTLSDGTCTDAAILRITVNGTTNAVLADDTVTVAEDSGTYVSGATSVLTNDLVNGSMPTGSAVASFKWNGQSASAGSSLTVSGVGVLTINANGSFTFNPVDDYTGAVPVATYVLATSGASATLSLTIQPANDAPTVTASTDAPGGSVDLVTTPEDTPIVLALSDFGTFADVDGDALAKVQVTTLPADGKLQAYNSGTSSWEDILANAEFTAADITAGKLRFVPDANENGTAYTTFGFKVHDGTTYSASAYTTTVNVTPVNDPPVNTVPATQVLNATPTTAFTTTLAFNSGNGNAITVADVENSLSTVVLSVSHGTLAATAGTGVTVSGSGTGTLTLTGTDKDNLNAVLATLQYTANDLFSGNDQLRIQTRDSGGLTDLDTVTLTVDADNRPLTVTGSTVNEASPYLMFTVAGVQGQYVQLSVAGVSATLGLDALPKLQYYAGAVTGWVNYTAGSFFKLPSATTPVRLAVLQDKLDEGSETLTLTARNQAATAHNGTGTIRDDGQGDIYLEDATSLTPSNFTDPLDDDRPLTITDPNDATLNGIVVNEDSPYGVLKVTGAAGQKVQLSLVNGSAVDADHGLLTNNSGTTEVEVYNGAGWVKYTTGEWVTLTGTSLLVRVAIKDDAVYEGPETLGVLATTTGGQTVSGTIVIVDDGTGSKYPDNITGAVDNTGTLDNDLAVTVTGYGPVNEGSTWAMFKVDGSQGAPILLGVAGSGTTQATTTGFTIQYSTNGTTWKAYSADAPPVVPGTLGGGTGTFYVRVNITSEADGSYEVSETFSLTGTVGAGATPAPASSAEVAIVDAGNGTLYTGDFSGGAPATDSSSTKDDDSSIGVSSPTVNEASPYAVFVVNAVAGSSLTLTVVEGSGAGFADIDQTQPIKYWNAATSQWSTYSSSVVVPANGTLLVRIDIQAEQDSPAVNEANETFQLRVSNGTAIASGTATIVDDGNGTIYPAGNPTNATTPLTDTTPANLDDDRALGVNSIRVNEASTHAVFEVTGIAGQLAKLALANGTALGGATTPTDGSVDYGTGLEYWHATNGWVAYTTNSWALIPAGNLLYVRTTLVNDTAAEGDQTFTLAATNTGGRATTGTATIDDTGGGVIYTFDPTTNAPTGTTTTGLNTDAAAPPPPPPPPPPAPPPFTANLDPTTDTGALDNVTRITEPQFTLNGGTYLQPGRTARLVDPSGAVIGSATVTTTEAQSGKINVPTGQLDDGVYTYTAQILDAQGNVVASAPVTVTIVTDRDGVAPSIELSANGGDFNDDGILDWEQNNVAQLPVTSYADFLQGRNAPDATFGAILAGRPDASQPGGVALDAGAQLVGISLAPLPAGAPLPTGTRAVSDLYKFSVTSVAGGQLTDIDVRPGLQTQTVIDLPAGVQANAYLKYNATTRTWKDFTNPAAQFGLVDGAALLDTNGDGRIDRIVLTLTDGGPGDEDGVVNGTIVDPGLLALTGPLITGPSGGPGAAASEKTVPEGTVPVTRFTANEPVTWKVSGGSEAGQFSIAPDGQLVFKAAPDYEAPLDADHNNSYLLQVEATNAAGAKSVQSVTVFVTDRGVPIYYAATGTVGDRTLSATPAGSADDRPLPNAPTSATLAAQVQFYAADPGTPGTVPLKAWQNVLTGDWFYGRADVAPPYACYVERPEVVLGNVLPAGQGVFDVHTYLNGAGVTQVMGQAAAEKLGLLAQGYVDLGAAYLFASADNVTLVGVAS
ncbi:tandem-95 repeat protein [Ramlibacter sp. MAHUQ-53]|uniref:tandem-95 repeat protein n=1 Tax=unclassified Ramlibacter TaxID=2617605 RepID=UPI003641EB41